MKPIYLTIGLIFSFSISHGQMECTDADLYCNCEPLKNVTLFSPGVSGTGEKFCDDTAVNTGPFWWCFFGNDDDVTVGITNESCKMGDGIQAAVYEGCSKEELDCWGDAAPVGDTRTLNFYGKSCVKYCVLIDAYSSAVCRMDFSVDGCGEGEYQVLPFDEPVESVCSGATIDLEAQIENGFNCEVSLDGIRYYWTVNGVVQSEISENFALEVPSSSVEGTVFELCVSAQDQSCQPQYVPSCKTLIVNASQDIDLGIVELCEGDVHTTPSGKIYNEAGKYSAMIDNNGCDYVEDIEIVIVPSEEVEPLEVYSCLELDGDNAKVLHGSLGEVSVILENYTNFDQGDNGCKIFDVRLKDFGYDVSIFKKEFVKQGGSGGVFQNTNVISRQICVEDSTEHPWLNEMIVTNKFTERTLRSSTDKCVDILSDGIYTVEIIGHVGTKYGVADDLQCTLLSEEVVFE